MVDFGPTPPSQCGLAIALPGSRLDVEAALLAAHRTGYVRYQDYVGRAASRGDSENAVRAADRLWASAFSEVAEQAEGLVASAEGYGVRVARHAGLADVIALFEERLVVTIIAHWRGPEISEIDVIAPVEVIVRSIAGEACELAQRIRQALDADWRARIERAESEAERRSRVAEMLNNRLSREPVLIDLGNVRWHLDLPTLRHLNRDGLDAVWPGLLRPGNRLELADGHFSDLDIAKAIPADWCGILDLSSCQSTQIASQVKRGRPDRLVISNESETNPLLRLPMLGLVYQLLSHGGRNYIDARLELAEMLRRSL